VDGNYVNYGVVIKAVDLLTRFACYSSDELANTTKRPKLEITYLNQLNDERKKQDL